MKRSDELLKAYMALAQQIRPNRIVSDLPANEALILALLSEEDGNVITPSLIVKECGMLKSQVNKHTRALEQRGLLTRTPVEEDRRKVCLRITEKGKKVYAETHRESLAYVDAIIEHFGDEKSKELTELLQEALAAVMKQKESSKK